MIEVVFTFQDRPMMDVVQFCEEDAMDCLGSMVFSHG